MRFPLGDVVATTFVAVAVIGYAVWSTVTDDPSATSVRVLAGLVLAAGFAASATAVVPAFDALLHGSKVYLACASLLGVAALVSGLAALVGADELMLTLLVLATVVLWVMATLRHVLASGGGERWSHLPGAHTHG